MGDVDDLALLNCARDHRVVVRMFVAGIGHSLVDVPVYGDVYGHVYSHVRRHMHSHVDR